MRNLLLIGALIISIVSLGQESGKKEITVKITDIGLDDAEGDNTPYIEFTDNGGNWGAINYLLPEISAQKWQEITVDGDLLIKVENTRPYSDDYPNIIEFEYLFNQDVANKLKGKIVIITYYRQFDKKHILGYIDYLNSIELIK